MSKFTGLSNYFKWSRLSTDLILNIAALVVGAGTGLGAVVFIWLLGQIEQVTAWAGTFASPFGLIAIMVVAGLIVGFLVGNWALEAKGHGVPEVMEAVALRNGRIRARVAAIKVMASSMTIGVGGSAGREGPIVQVGSALGSVLGQKLRLSSDELRTLVACGAAAGIAATFNAPIAGAIFALEVILGRFTVRYFGSVVLSAVAGSVVSRIFLSGEAMFSVPSYPLNHLGEIPIYLVLSVVVAFAAVLFIRVLYKAEDVFDEWNVPLAYKAAIGMGLTAIIALVPHGEGEILGSGVHFIGAAIADNFEIPLATMAVLFVLKLLATTATLGSGNSGGVFAPALFMGAIVGGMVGTVAHQLWPSVAANPGAYAIVGMAAMFSASARAPITAILIVFEMSGDYQLILPLMMATVLATLIAERLFKESIYTLKLAQRGIRLQQGRDEDILAGITVGEAMQTEIATVLDTLTLADISQRLEHSHQHGFPIVNSHHELVGLVTLGDMERAIQNGMSSDTPVLEIGVPLDQLEVMEASQSIGEALQVMGRGGFGRIPVIDRDNKGRLIGMITRYDIVNAYNIGLTRRAELQHRSKQVQAGNIDGTEFVDIEIKDDFAAKGKTIRVVGAHFPRDCVLVSIRRNGRMLIPHADTVLQSGDLLTAYGTLPDAEALGAYLATGVGKFAERQQHEKELNAFNIDGTQFVDVTIQPDDDANGKTIQELAADLPHDCVLVSIRRKGRMLTPHGDPVLQADDHITAYGTIHDAEELCEVLHRKG